MPGPTSFIDPRTYGVLSDEEKAYKLRHLYPQMFVNSDDPNYPGGFGQNIDYDNLPADEGTDPSALGKLGVDSGDGGFNAPWGGGETATGSPGTTSSAAQLAAEMGPNSPGASKIPPAFIEKYGGWGGTPTGGAEPTADGTISPTGAGTTADGTPDPMGGWGGVPNATPPAVTPGAKTTAPVKSSSNWEREPTDAEKATGTVIPNIGGPLGVPDTTSGATTPTSAPGAPPMDIPKSSGKFTSPTGALGTAWRGEDPATTGGGVYPRPHGTLPNGPPLPPATRLQPGIDRAALYRQLRPYPGMSRSEKLSNMLASAFASAAQPGTGDPFKDAARGFAQGSGDYQKMIDYDRATRAQYATSVLGQVAGQEEAARKRVDTEADVAKKYAEANRANAYGGFLGGRTEHMLTQLGPAALINAEANRTKAATDANKMTVVGPGSVGTRVDPTTGRVIAEVNNPVQHAESAQQQQTRQAVFLVNAREEVLGRQLTPDEWNETMRFGLRGYAPAGSTSELAQIQAIGKLPPEQQGPAMAKLKAEVRIKNEMNPPRTTVLQMPLGDTVKEKGIGEFIQDHLAEYTKDGVIDYPRFKADVLANATTKKFDMTPYGKIRYLDIANKLGFSEKEQTTKTTKPPQVDKIADRQAAATEAKLKELEKTDPQAAAAMRLMLKKKAEREAAAKAQKGLK